MPPTSCHPSRAAHLVPLASAGGACTHIECHDMVLTHLAVYELVEGLGMLSWDRMAGFLSSLAADKLREMSPQAQPAPQAPAAPQAGPFGYPPSSPALGLGNATPYPAYPGYRGTPAGPGVAAPSPFASPYFSGQPMPSPAMSRGPYGSPAPSTMMGPGMGMGMGMGAIVPTGGLAGYGGMGMGMGMGMVMEAAAMEREGAAKGESEGDEVLFRAMLHLIETVVRYGSEPTRVQLFDRLVRQPSPGPSQETMGPLLRLLLVALSPALKGALMGVLGAFAASPALAEKVWAELEQSQYLPTGGPLSMGSPYQGTITHDLDQAETRQESYPCTIAFVDMLRQLLGASFPSLLGLPYREPGPHPYVSFIRDHVYLEFDVLHFRYPGEQCALLGAVLRLFVEVALLAFDVPHKLPSAVLAARVRARITTWLAYVRELFSVFAKMSGRGPLACKGMRAASSQHLRHPRPRIPTPASNPSSPPPPRHPRPVQIIDRFRESPAAIQGTIAAYQQHQLLLHPPPTPAGGAPAMTPAAPGTPLRALGPITDRLAGATGAASSPYTLPLSLLTPGAATATPAPPAGTPGVSAAAGGPAAGGARTDLAVSEPLGFRLMRDFATNPRMMEKLLLVLRMGAILLEDPAKVPHLAGCDMVLFLALRLLESLLGAEQAFSAILRVHPSPHVVTMPSARLAKEHAHIVNLARLVDYPHPALPLYAVRVLALLGTKVPALVSILTPHRAALTEAFAHALTQPPVALDYEQSPFPGALPAAPEERSLCATVLRLLLSNLTDPAAAPAPNLAHFLLGFDRPRAPSATLSLPASPCLEGLVSLLAQEAPGPDAPLAQQEVHGLCAELGHTILWRLCADQPTARPVLDFLRERGGPQENDYFVAHLASLTAPGPTFSLALWLSEAATIKQRSMLERLLRELFREPAEGSDSLVGRPAPADGGAPGAGEQRALEQAPIPVLDMLLAIDQAPPPAEGEDGAGLAEGGEGSAEGATEGAGLLTAQLGALDGWRQLVEVGLMRAPMALAPDALVAVLFKLLVPLLHKIGSSLTAVPVATILSHTALFILTRLRESPARGLEEMPPPPAPSALYASPFPSAPFESAAPARPQQAALQAPPFAMVPIGLCHSVLRGLVAGLLRRQSSEVLRGTLSAGLLSYLHHTHRDMAARCPAEGSEDAERLARVQQGNVSILRQTEGRLVDVVLAELGAPDVWQAVAFSTLEALVRIDGAHWRALLAMHGLPQQLLGVLSRLDRDLLRAVLNPDSLKALFVYESLMGLLLRQAQGPQGAAALVEHALEPWIPPATERYRQLLLPLLRLVVAVLSTHRQNEAVVRQALDFLAAHYHPLVATLKQATPAISLGLASEMALVTGLVAQLGPHPGLLYQKLHQRAPKLHYRMLDVLARLVQWPARAVLLQTADGPLGAAAGPMSGRPLVVEGAADGGPFTLPPGSVLAPGGEGDEAQQPAVPGARQADEATELTRAVRSCTRNALRYARLMMDTSAEGKVALFTADLSLGDSKVHSVSPGGYVRRTVGREGRVPTLGCLLWHLNAAALCLFEAMPARGPLGSGPFPTPLAAGPPAHLVASTPLDQAILMDIVEHCLVLLHNHLPIYIAHAPAASGLVMPGGPSPAASTPLSGTPSAGALCAALQRQLDPLLDRLPQLSQADFLGCLCRKIRDLLATHSTPSGPV
ncbi:putative Nuclear pore complex protein [Paratrimastix pyriformis]|uniref:Nuclear pore complex protein n=1 Tax=Paratrimastix pyriformis TaxID=342808 RepID=A0ABQ8UJ38_9EUKA|nr:putative Nuclear pore complex protein [Paratrimastix pyriformis]